MPLAPIFYQLNTVDAAFFRLNALNTAFSRPTPLTPLFLRLMAVNAAVFPVKGRQRRFFSRLNAVNAFIPTKKRR